MNLFSQIRDSIYNPLFYRGLLDKTLGYSLGYYFKLAAALALLSAVFFAVAVVPDLNRGLWQIEKSLTTLYPAGLVLEVQDGVLAKNIKEPVVIPFPPGWSLAEREQLAAFKHFIVIDTAGPATRAGYEASQAVIFVTAKEIIAPGERGGGTIQILPLDPDMNWSLDQDKIKTFLAAVRPWYVLAAPVAVLLTFVVFMFLSFLLLLPLFVLALLVFILLRLMTARVGRLVSFGAAYRLSLHAVTLPLLVSFFFIFISDGVFGPALFAATALFIVFLNFYHLPPHPSSPDLAN